jgi:threonine dehydratase
MAALLFEAFDYDDGETIVPALCGGNIDTNQLTTVLVRGLVETGRYLKIRTVLRDRPGALEELVEIIAAERANIYAVQHDRTSRDVAMNEADIEIDIETRGHDHIDEVLDALERAGYHVEVLA